MAKRRGATGVRPDWANPGANTTEAWRNPGAASQQGAQRGDSPASYASKTSVAKKPAAAKKYKGYQKALATLGKTGPSGPVSKAGRKSIKKQARIVKRVAKRRA